MRLPRTVIILILAVGSISSCKKDEGQNTAPPSSDIEPPVIFISGTNPRIHRQGAVWFYPSATALDSVDGDVTATIVRTGYVDENVVGTYYVYYTAHDSQQNTNTDTLRVDVIPVTRFVDFVPGSYSGHDSCSVTSPFNYSLNIFMIGSSCDSIRIKNFGGFGVSVYVTAVADTINSTLSFPVPQTLTGAASLVSATGAYSHVGLHTDITIWYNWADAVSTESCTSQYIK